MRSTTTARVVGLALTLALLLSACGDDSGDAATPPEVDPDERTEEPGDGDDVPDTEGGGSATLTVGDETWEFDAVVCAFGPEETGRDDTDFVLSSVADGLQLDATINAEFGHSVSLDDIEDFEDPRVGWYAGGPLGGVTDDGTFIDVDGDEVSAQAEFVDGTDDLSTERVPGTLTATCP